MNESLFAARSNIKKRIDYMRVRTAIAEIKILMKEETDRENKIVLAEAGLNLNKLLLK